MLKVIKLHSLNTCVLLYVTYTSMMLFIKTRTYGKDGAHVCPMSDFLGSQLSGHSTAGSSWSVSHDQTPVGKGWEVGWGGLDRKAVSPGDSGSPQELWTRTALTSCPESRSGSWAPMPHFGSSCRGDSLRERAAAEGCVSSWGLQSCVTAPLIVWAF